MADLLTTRQVQELLQVDRTTIYRLVEAGQLPAIRVGKQWRFERAELDRWLQDQTVSPEANAPARHVASSVQPAPVTASTATDRLAELLPMVCSQVVQDVLADALGVMIVITDMEGQPVTQVSNPCGLYAAVMSDATAIARCVQNWHQLAGDVSLEPRFSESALGLLCARGLIRLGAELKGMVFVGGIAPAVWPPNSQEIVTIADHFGLDVAYVRAHIDEVYRLDTPAQERVLPFVQRIADLFSHILEDRNVLYSRLQAIASLATLQG